VVNFTLRPLYPRGVGEAVVPHEQEAG
jgi:hypothetical protein